MIKYKEIKSLTILAFLLFNLSIISTGCDEKKLCGTSKEGQELIDLINDDNLDWIKSEKQPPNYNNPVASIKLEKIEILINGNVYLNEANVRESVFINDGSAITVAVESRLRKLTMKTIRQTSYKAAEDKVKILEEEVKKLREKEKKLKES